jgi:hypothetical protein
LRICQTAENSLTTGSQIITLRRLHLAPMVAQQLLRCVNAANGIMQSAIYLLDLNSEKPQQPFAVFEGNMLFDVSWNGDTVVTAFGDQAAVMIDADTRKKIEYKLRRNAANCILFFCRDDGIGPFTLRRGR